MILQGRGGGFLTCLDFFEQTVARYPHKLAFADERESLTFSQMQALGRSIGTALHHKIRDIRRPVAILTTHSVCDIAAFIGTMYAGCFYVPLDGRAPQEHIQARLDILDPALVLAPKSIADLPQVPADDVLLSSIRKQVFTIDPAYAIFTSGSTGIAKAAVVQHSALVNLATCLCDLFGFSQQTVFAGQSPFYFDGSGKELYCTLFAGATLHLLPKKLFISPLHLMRRVAELKADALLWAGAAVKLVAVSGVFDTFVPPGVRHVVFGGENMPGKILNIWQAAMPEAMFANVYGPTETAVDATYYIVDRSFSDEESVPIGIACHNTEVFLLDEEKKPVPRGMSGEIYIKGAGVGLGYYKNPTQTAAVFLQNPLHNNYRDMVYKTGDIARENEYGELVYLSRADGQVKHMGSRVELGEIEAVVAGIEGVEALFCSYDKEKGKILLFYQGAIDSLDLSRQIAARLPRYMQPNYIDKRDVLPRLPNGKLDRVLLRKEYDETATSG